MALLNRVNTPDDLKKLPKEQLTKLGEEIRAFLIDSVSKTGGHLSSNLGTIDMTLALHWVFSSPRDQFVWDVGHQCYTHKLLTGRREGFSQLRKRGGISGFPKPEESRHDIFVAGHGNTSLSAAIGLAQAKKLKSEPGKVIAIIGDGAFTGGMVYEGMNNIRNLNNLIVILNDNEMSISKNVGAIAQYFTKLRTAPRYFKAKRDVETALDCLPWLGGGIKTCLQSAKSAIRRSIYHSTMFEDMGFQYVGPINGHDVPEMCTLFSAYRDEQSAPLLIHVCTIKGRGFLPAEKNPGEFHGVSSFNANEASDLTDPELSPALSFSNVFGQKLAELGKEDKRICAITAAMKYGTGLQFFYKQHKPRFFDVGMAEQHAVTFAAGLSVNGMKPVVAIYSTFLQRAFDQLIHDVNLMHADVLFAIDRAGLVPADGDTHQGVYDTAFPSSIDGMRLVSVCNYEELEYWLERLMKESGPRALRYPRGAQDERLAQLGCSGKAFDLYKKEGESAHCLLVTYGAETKEVLKAAEIARENGLAADVLKLNVLHPLPDELYEAVRGYRTIVFAEEGIHGGGIAEHFAARLFANGMQCRYRAVAVDSLHLITATADELREQFGLDAKALYQTLKEVDVF